MMASPKIMHIMRLREQVARIAEFLPHCATQT